MSVTNANPIPTLKDILKRVSTPEPDRIGTIPEPHEVDYKGIIGVLCFHRFLRKEMTDDVFGIAADSQNNVIFGDRDGYLTKASPTGEIIWQYQSGDHIRDIAVDKNDDIYLARRNDEVHKVSSDGDIVWKFTGHSGIVWKVRVDADLNVYSIGNSDQKVIKINPDKDGSSIDGNDVLQDAVEWENEDFSANLRTLSIDNEGNSFVSDQDGNVRKIDSDGVGEAFKSVGGRPTDTSFRNGFLYLVAQDSAGRKVIKIDADTSNTVWEFALTDDPFAVYADEADNVYSGSGNRLIKLRPDGTEAYRHGFFNENIQSVFARNGFAYASSSDNSVIKISDELQIKGYGIIDD